MHRRVPVFGMRVGSLLPAGFRGKHWMGFAPSHQPVEGFGLVGLEVRPGLDTSRMLSGNPRLKCETWGTRGRWELGIDDDGLTPFGRSEQRIRMAYALCLCP